MSGPFFFCRRPLCARHERGQPPADGLLRLIETEFPRRRKQLNADPIRMRGIVARERELNAAEDASLFGDGELVGLGQQDMGWSQ
jgi:hypothetical protein